MTRQGWIDAHAEVSQKRECVLADVSRTTVYAKRKPVVFVEADEVLKRLIDEEYTRHPFYGSRKMVVYLARGFAYLVAVIDWYSRRVLSWRVSNSMEAAFCVDCLGDASRKHGKPEVFNSDQKN